MTPIIAKDATFMRYYEYKGTIYFCFANTPSREKAGFVSKQNNILWLYDDEIRELPPECDSFDWVPHKPDPWAKLKAQLTQVRASVNQWNAAKSTCIEAQYERGYLDGMEFVIHEVQLNSQAPPSETQAPDPTNE